MYPCVKYTIIAFITLLQCKVVIRSVFCNQTYIQIYASAIHLFFHHHGWNNYGNGDPQTK